MTQIALPPQLTNVPTESFLNCKSLAKIDLPLSITNIGSKAFANCWSLKNVTVPGSVATMGANIFLNCKGLQWAKLSDGVEQIPAGMFENCSSLASLSLPETLLYIGSSCIYGCDKLRNLTIPRSVKTIDSAGLLNNLNDASKRIVFKCAPPVVLGSSLALISYEAIGIPAEFYSTWYAFLPSCNGGISSYNPLFHFYVSWDYTYTTNGNEATITGTTFKDASVLLKYGPTSLTIPSTIGGRRCTSIAEGAFKNHTKVTAVYFYSDSSLREIGESAFAGCEALVSFAVPTSVVRICKNAFANTPLTAGVEIIRGDWLVEMSNASLTSYEVPDGVKHIADNAFVKAKALKEIDIGDQVQSIGEDAFAGTALMTECEDGIVCADKWAIGYSGETPLCLNFPEPIRAVSDASFSGLNITGVVLNVNAKYIGARAFAECKNLKRVVCEPDILEINDSAFDGCAEDIVVGPIVHLVKFDVNGVSCTVQDMIVHDLRPIGTLPELNGDSFNLDFLGWYLEKDGIKIDSDYVVTENITLCARWKKKTYVVTMMPNYIGGQTKTNVYEHGSVLGDLGMLSRDDYRFIGWFSESNGGDQMLPEMMVVSNVIVYAHWAEEYTVVYHGNGGTGEMPNDYLIVGESLSSNAFRKSGYIFAGWATSVQGNIVYGDAQAIGKIDRGFNHLYAQWAVDSQFVAEETDDGGMTVTGIKEDPVGILVIPDSLGGRPVVGIGRLAFVSCANLTAVIIPNGIETIGEYAFVGCANLTAVRLPSSVKEIQESAFKYCEGLNTIDIPSSVKNIGDWAFYGCSKLQSIQGASGVRELGKYGFGNCASLKDVMIPSNVVIIGKSAFRDCTSITNAVLAEGVTMVGESMFYGCSSLQRVSLPRSLETYGKQAFGGCESISTVTIPLSSRCVSDIFPLVYKTLTRVNVCEGESSICSNAFRSCYNIRMLQIPITVTNIGENAFWGCDALESIQIPSCKGMKKGSLSGLRIKSAVVCEGETQIIDGMFQDCTFLKSVELPSGIKSIGAEAFSGCQNLQKVNIPDGVEYIGEAAFWNCSALGEITLPSSLKHLRFSAFNGCSSLTSLILPSALTIIESSLCNECASLKSVVIPDGVLEIADSAFYGCTSLSNFAIPESVRRISIAAFPRSAITPQHGLFLKDGWLFGAESSVTNVVIQKEVRMLVDSAFAGNENLRTVVIDGCPSGMGQYAFSYCSGLTNVVINNEEMDSISAYAFANTPLKNITLPSNVRTIGEGAFAGCGQLDTINLPLNLTSIGGKAFYNCYSLKDPCIPTNVNYIGCSAFLGCASLSKIVIPESVIDIGASAFRGCRSLSTVTIDRGSRSFGSNAFIDNAKLTKINLLDVAGWCSSTFEDETSSPLQYAQLYVADQLASHLSIPDGVVCINDNAFFGCDTIQSVDFPDTLKQINQYAFRECEGIESVSFPDNMISLGRWSFWGCTALKEITLHSKLDDAIRGGFYFC